MKLVAIALLSLGFVAPQVKPNQIEINQVAALVTSEKSTPLTESAALSLNSRTSMILEPGVQANKIEGGFSLSTLDGSKLEIETISGKVSLMSPAKISVSESKIELGAGNTLSASTVMARRLAQDDTDTNLKSMQESAKKLKTKNAQEANQPPKKLKWRFLFGENPFPTAETFNQQAIQQLTHLSPIGF